MNYLHIKYKFLLSTLIYIVGLFCISSFILIMNCNIDLLQKNIFNINCLLLINIIIAVCNIKNYINLNDIIHIHRKYKINFYVLKNNNETIKLLPIILLLNLQNFCRIDSLSL